MVIIQNIFFSLLETVILYFFLYKVMKRGEHISEIAYGICAGVQVIIAAAMRTVWGGRVNAIPVFFVFYVAVVCRRVLKKSLQSALAAGLLFALLKLSYGPIWYLISGIIGTSFEAEALVYELMAQVFLAVSLYLYMKLIRKVTGEVSRAYHMFFKYVPAVCIFIQWYLIEHILDKIEQKETIFLCLGAFLFILILNLCLYYYYDMIREYEESREKILMISRQLAHYRQMHRFYSYVEGINEDYRKHLNTISSLAGEESGAEVQRYIYTIQGSLENKYEIIPYTNNDFVDAVLSEKKKVAAEHCIAYFVEAEDLEDKIQEPSRLGMMMGSALDHAMKDCIRIRAAGKKYAYVKIRLCMDEKNENIVFCVTNSSKNSKSDIGRFIGRKEERDGYDAEMKEIELAVEQLGGICTYGYEKHTFSFIARIPRKTNYYKKHA